MGTDAEDVMQDLDPRGVRAAMIQYSPGVLTVALLCLLGLAPSAWAGPGWYLLGQPSFVDTETDELIFVRDAPPPKMEQLGAFNSATACEMEHLHKLVEASDKVLMATDALKEAQRAGEASLIKARKTELHVAETHERCTGTLVCIAADDPRLRS